MKTSNHASKSSSKSKKTSREREKRKSQGVADLNNQMSVEKVSPTKESTTRLYAGIDSESLGIYAEQLAVEQLSEEVSNTLIEDVNYRLRYIINEALIKARLLGRNAINFSDIDETFSNLKIDTVYGATSSPNWVNFGHQNLFYLEDNQINLVREAKLEKQYVQFGETLITKKWGPYEISSTLKRFFITTCQMIVSNEDDQRKAALKCLNQSSLIGQISEWFYNFGYILLSKDITYDCLTLRALELIEVLENNPISRVCVLDKQLTLLVRLILQRLLKSTTSVEVLKPACSVLCLLCERMPLREFVIFKILQKMPEICETHALSVITILNFLGVDAVEAIFLPNMNIFLTASLQNNPHYISAILQTYSILCRGNLVTLHVYETFSDIFGDTIIALKCAYDTANVQADLFKNDINFVSMKHDLISTMKRTMPEVRKGIKHKIADVFDMPHEKTKLKKMLDQHTFQNVTSASRVNSSLVIGKNSLILPLFQQKKVNVNQGDFLLYNI